MRVLAPKQKSAFKYVGTFIRYIQAPLHTQFVQLSAQVGRVEVPVRKWISKSFVLPGAINLPGVFAIILGTFW